MILCCDFLDCQIFRRRTLKILTKFVLFFVLLSSSAFATFLQCPNGCGTKYDLGLIDIVKELESLFTPSFKEILEETRISNFYYDYYWKSFELEQNTIYISEWELENLEDFLYEYDKWDSEEESWGWKIDGYSACNISYDEFHEPVFDIFNCKKAAKSSYNLSFEKIDNIYELFAGIRRILDKGKNDTEISLHLSKQEAEKKLSSIHNHPESCWDLEKEARINFDSFMSSYEYSLKCVRDKYKKYNELVSKTQANINLHQKNIYTRCLVHHNWIGAVSNLGLIEFMNGNSFDAISYIDKFLDRAKEDAVDSEKISQIYTSKGQALSEIGLYYEAITSLSKAIEENPKNKEAYVERAKNYFETGNFELAFSDFINSDIKVTQINDSHDDLWGFAKGFVSGAASGAFDATIEFLPGLLSMLRGLSHAVYEIGADPKNFSKESIQSAKNIYEFVVTSNFFEIFSTIIPELKNLSGKKGELTDIEKGRIMGHIIGRYGTDIFLISGSARAVALCREFKSASTISAIEKVALDIEKKQILLRVWEERKALAASLKDKGNQAGKELYKALRNEVLSENEIRLLLHEAGYKTFPKPKGVPQNWGSGLTKKAGGMQYTDPNNSSNLIRVMPGNPHSPNMRQQKPYIVQQKNGKAFDKYGNLLELEDPNLHIPISEFVFRG